MAEYIDKEKLLLFIHKTYCEECSRGGVPCRSCWVDDMRLEIADAPTADVVEVVHHGKWHIMPEDLGDESECPTEAGWYQIITVGGEEMTDYYFNKPTMSGRGVVYWKNCNKGIRAWAKMDGKVLPHKFLGKSQDGECGVEILDGKGDAE